MKNPCVVVALLSFMLAACVTRLISAPLVTQGFETGDYPGAWVVGSPVYDEPYSEAGGIMNRAATFGDQLLFLNRNATTSYLYLDSGISFEPNTTYTLSFYAGARQHTSNQLGGVLEFGFWDGVPVDLPQRRRSHLI